MRYGSMTHVTYRSSPQPYLFLYTYFPGHRLGGPPLCYHPCGTCLATWQHSIILTPAAAALLAKVDPAFVPRVDPLVSAPVSPLDAPYLYDPLVGRVDPLVDAYRVGCGYANGKELLGYYTMAQTSFLLFIVVVVAVTVCLAWRVADEGECVLLCVVWLFVCLRGLWRCCCSVKQCCIFLV